MRTTRVKPYSITSPAIGELKWLKKFGIGLAVLCIVAIPVRFLYVLRTQPSAATTPAAAAGGTRVTQQRCLPGSAPEGPTRLTQDTSSINPDGCDLTYAVVKGTVILEGPSASLKVSAGTNVVGRRDYAVYKTARAAGSEALMYYMLCPKGKGPEDGGWQCRS